MNENNNNKVFWGILILVILIIIFIFLWQFKTPNNTEDKTIQKQESKENITRTGNLDEIAKGIKEDYKKSDSFKKCISQDSGINQCFVSEVNRKIKETGDVSYCNDLNSKASIDSCIASYYETKALASKNISFCEKAYKSPEFQDNCKGKVYREQAIASLDSSICQKISGFEKNSCIERVVTRKAVNKLDDKICNEIKGPEISSCKSEVKFLKNR